MKRSRTKHILGACSRHAVLFVVTLSLVGMGVPPLALAAEQDTANDNSSVQLYSLGQDETPQANESNASSTPAVPSVQASSVIRVSGTNIQAVLDQAGSAATASNPVTVVVPAGTYAVSCLYISSNTYLSLEPGAVVKGSNTYHILKARGGTNRGYNGPSNIKVSGGTWEAGPNNVGIFMFIHCNNITFSNLTIKGGYLHAVNLSASNNVTFENVTFKDTYASPAGSGRVGLEDLAECIHLDIANGATTEETGQDGTPPGKVVIRNCTFDNVHACIGRHNVNVTKHNRSNATSASITGCTFKNVKQRILNSELLDNVTFSNNTISGSVPEKCIVALDSKNLKISGTRGLKTIDLSKTTGSIQDVSVSGTKERGIFIRSGSNVTLSNVKVVPNNGTGVEVYSSARATLNKVAITNAKNHGIKINDKCNVVIQDSSIVNTTGNGIQIGSNSTVKVSHSSIMSTTQTGVSAADGSKLSMSNSSVASAGADGIQLWRAGASSITNCKVVKSKAVGIVVGATSNTTINNNVVQDSTSHGIQLHGACKNVKVTNNVSNSNINTKNKAEFLLSSASRNVTFTGNKYGPRQLWIDTKSITNKNNKRYSYKSLLSDTPEVVSNVWSRVWGNNQFDTMESVVKMGWATGLGGTVVIATGNNFPDALSASGVAGLYNAPILLVNKSSLPAQTKRELQRIRPTRIIIAGGGGAIKTAVENDIKKTVPGASVVRSFGQTATDTAAKLNRDFFGTRSSTAILATSRSFYDALAAAPVAYAKHYPVFLAENKDKLSAYTLSSMVACGIKDVIIVGGERGAISSKVVAQLSSKGIGVAERLWGQDHYDTSREIAKWGVAHGMSANRMGVATSKSYYDALTGAALCGKNNAVLVLADDRVSKGKKNVDSGSLSFTKANKGSIKQGYVFGGKYAVSIPTYNTCDASTRT